MHSLSFSSSHHKGSSSTSSSSSSSSHSRGRKSSKAEKTQQLDEEEEAPEDVISDDEDDEDNPTSRVAYDFSSLKLREDHANRPIWVCPDGHVFFETFSPIYKQAYDFLIAIAEPLCRPELIHEYRVTNYSLYAAASVGLRTDDIISGLKRMSKNVLPEALIEMVKQRTLKCGKVKLLLKRNRYFVESIYADTLTLLLENETIRKARVDDKDGMHRLVQKLNAAAAAAAVAAAASAPSSSWPVPGSRMNVIGRPPTPSPSPSPVVVKPEYMFEAGMTRDEDTGFLVEKGPSGGIVIQGTKQTAGGANAVANQAAAMGLDDIQNLDGDDDNGGPKRVLSFEVDADQVELVKETCVKQLEYPMLEEYDFRHDDAHAELPINLKPAAQIRNYQEKSLSKMFGNGRARSGLIVLPCGAGKTLVGITATTTVKKGTIVFCTTGVAVEQWKRQFQYWTTIPDRNICQFTSSIKEPVHPETCVLITTYNMVAFNGKRSAKAKEIMDIITQREWGLVVLDEVHVAPARMFRRCINVTHSRCKLGLTATLVREDELIEDLYYLIGPKLYEANWLDLMRAGHLARVQCVEVWCPMTAPFYRAYLDEESDQRRQMLLYVMNPVKFRSCEYLIRLHEARGDKVLVFSDNIYALETYAKTLNKLYICGKTSDSERLDVLARFQNDPNINCLFISKVGDNSIDLPDVNVIIQISSHYSSRRQEAQRLGRILRPKARTGSEYNAYFYSLVSKDTKEMYYSTKRQRFLVDQGYSFQVVPQLVPNDNTDLSYSTPASQHDLLMKVLSQEDEAADIEKDDADERIMRAERQQKRVPANRKRGNISLLSGDDGQVYAEFERRKADKKHKADGGSQVKRGAYGRIIAGGNGEASTAAASKKKEHSSALFRSHANKTKQTHKQFEVLRRQELAKQ